MANQEDLYPTYDMVFVRGDTWKRELLIQDPDPDSPDPENPVMIPRDLTGFSYRAQVRKSNKKAAELIATLEVTGDGVDGIFNETGKVYLHLTPVESTKCEKVGGWDLEETDPAGNVDTILGGVSDPFGDYSQ